MKSTFSSACHGRATQHRIFRIQSLLCPHRVHEQTFIQLENVRRSVGSSHLQPPTASIWAHSLAVHQMLREAPGDGRNGHCLRRTAQREDNNTARPRVTDEASRTCLRADVRVTITQETKMSPLLVGDVT